MMKDIKDYESACALHKESASVVSLNKAMHRYELANDHFYNLTSTDSTVIGEDVLALKSTCTAGYNTTVYKSNEKIRLKIEDYILLESLHVVNNTLVYQHSTKEPIYNRNGSKVIGIYTSSVDKTKELDKGELYKKYLLFYDAIYAKTGKPDKTDRTANRQYLQALGIDHLFYKIPTCAELSTLITVASTSLTLKEIAKVVGKKQFETFRNQLQNLKKCLKNEYSGDDISLYKPFFKPCIL